MAWRAAAACRDAPTDWFFPVSTIENPFQAQVSECCDTCPVRVDCLVFAVESRQEFGVWGGLTPQQRSRELKVHRAQPPEVYLGVDRVVSDLNG